MVEPLPEELGEVSAAARHIYDRLQSDGPYTQSELVAVLHYNPRTVARCTDMLAEHGLVETRVDTTDARRRVYEATRPEDS